MSVRFLTIIFKTGKAISSVHIFSFIVCNIGVVSVSSLKEHNQVLPMQPKETVEKRGETEPAPMKESEPAQTS